MSDAHKIALRTLTWTVVFALCMSSLVRSEPKGPEVAPGPRLRWLVGLGSETSWATPGPVRLAEPVWSSVPGAALAFAMHSETSVVVLRRVATDFSSGQGLVATPNGTVVADRAGQITLWAIPSDMDTASLDIASGGREALARLWERRLHERVSSIGWAGEADLWVATREGLLMALRAEDGTTVWETPIGGRAEAPPIGTASDVFIATQAHTLVRVDRDDGRVHWRASLAGPAIHSPAVVEGSPGVVICGTWAGVLSAFAIDDGAKLWSVDLDGRQSSAPLVLGEQIFVTREDGTLHALSLSGAPLWSTDGAAQGPAVVLPLSPRASSQAPSERHAGILVVSQRLVSLDAATGEILAAYPENAVTALRSRFHHAMMQGEHTYTQAEKAAILEREAFPLSGALFGAPRVEGDGLIFGTDEGWVYLFDLPTLRPRWRHHVSTPASSPPGLGERRIAVAAEDQLFGLNREDGRARWRRSLGGSARRIEVSRDRVAVLTQDRLQVFALADGARIQTDRRHATLLSAVPDTWPSEVSEVRWLVGDPAGPLVGLGEGGQPIAELSIEGDWLAPSPTAAPGQWWVATREGDVFRVEWTEASPQPASLADTESASESPAESGAQELARRPRGRGFLTTWQYTQGEPISEVRAAGSGVLIRLQTGPLVFVRAREGAEVWRLPLEVKDRFVITDGERVVMILSDDRIEIHDLESGALMNRREVDRSPLAAWVVDDALRWIDASGTVCVAAPFAGLVRDCAGLGVDLQSAAETDAGFLVTTVAGEVGWVNWDTPADREIACPEERAVDDVEEEGP